MNIEKYLLFNNQYQLEFIINQLQETSISKIKLKVENTKEKKQK